LSALVPIDMDHRRRRGLKPTLQDYQRRFPYLETVASASDPGENTAAPPVALPHVDEGATRTFQPLPTALSVGAEVPQTFGRYQVQRVLGQGGFGTVYQGWDPELRRAVAIKVPRGDGLAGRHIDNFLDEARRAVQLEHPGIIQIYDAGLC